MPSSVYWTSLTVQFCSVFPASALVTDEIPRVTALLASLVPSSLGVGESGGFVSSHMSDPASLFWAQRSSKCILVSMAAPGSQVLQARAIVYPMQCCHVQHPVLGMFIFAERGALVKNLTFLSPILTY